MTKNRRSTQDSDFAPRVATETDAQDVAYLLARVDKLNQLGIALSSERDTKKLLENILLGAKDLTNADAGTLYTKTEESTLRFEIIRTDSLNIAMGGTTGIDIPFPALPLYKDGQPNLQMIAAAAALRDCTINIPDAYEAEGFDFAGTKKFDQMTGYRSKSFLTVPLKNHENEIIGVLQLINAKEAQTGVIRAFTQADQQLAESLASQAAIAMTTQRLIEDLKKLFEAFIQAIANAIDDKSPYTGGHCERVPVLTEMLARAAGRSQVGVLKDYCPTEEDLYELRIAAWMHDCGKVVTPEYVIDKSTKLQTIHDRIHTVDARFEVLKRDAEIEFLQQKMAAMAQEDHAKIPGLEETFKQHLSRIASDQQFVRETNIGGEFMSADRQERIREIGKRQWTNSDDGKVNFLTEDEMNNLNIPKGTLTPEERAIINHHVVATKNMLKNLPFPKHLSHVTEMAGAHHETMNGKGYPDGLTRDQMSVGARIMAIADVFEALTATDRPYKPAKTLSETLKILGFMKKDQHVDPDLFKVFIDEKVYMEYAQAYLEPKQIDEVSPNKIPGYDP
ncbi:MAG: metal dependent phosphohydrolase [Magnetococcales bacterium]|nr:metal dependent phosphohydrolase [Magnetococcales bacterium]